jgi:two-component system, NtrC family, C4-dicarboxylate transport sensor histidine kinase DctB
MLRNPRPSWMLGADDSGKNRASMTAKPPTALRLWPIAALCLAVLAGLGWGVHEQTRARAFAELHERGQNTLSLAQSSLRGQLARFERLPGLLAEKRAIRSLLLAPRNPDLVMAANIYLRETAELLGASDHLCHVSAMAKRWRPAISTSRTALSAAISPFAPISSMRWPQGEGRFYALGTTSNKRGYYFGAPIDVAGQRRGVMVIKIDLDEIEQAWASEEVRIICDRP